jgi:hypothetical protein
MAQFIGTAGGDDFIGTDDNDHFLLQDGGDDSAFGDDGNDTFRMGASLTAADTLDGGDGNRDAVKLVGTTAPVVFSATTMTNVEVLYFKQGSFDITTDDATVALGQDEMSINAMNLKAGNTLVFDGSAETDASFNFRCDNGNQTLTGGALADNFTFVGGGTAVAYGGGGSDFFRFDPDGFSVGDSFDGGRGRDELELISGFGASGSPVTFAADTMSSIKKLTFSFSANSYLKLDDGNVGAGKTLIVGVDFPGGGGVTFDVDGSAETDGHFVFNNIQSSLNIFRGGDNADVFNSLTPIDSVDQFFGGGGDDVFNMGNHFEPDFVDDTIDGGGGNDTVYLEDSADKTFDADTMVNVERLVLLQGHPGTNKITLDDGNIAAGERLIVDATAAVGDPVDFHASNESDGALDFLMGTGGTFEGGAGDDTFTGFAGGLHRQLGGGGSDTYIYADPDQSTSIVNDWIQDFDADSDAFDTPVTVAAFAGTFSGSIDTATFDADVDALLTDFDAGEAAAVTATSGDLSGNTFIVVDANGDGAYSANDDYLFTVTGFGGTFDAGDFI